MEFLSREVEGQALRNLGNRFDSGTLCQILRDNKCCNPKDKEERQKLPTFLSKTIRRFLFYQEENETYQKVIVHSASLLILDYLTRGI